MRMAIPLDWFSGRDVPSTLVVDLACPDPEQATLAKPARTAGLEGKHVVLDPGHGEVEDGVNDPGATNQKLNLSERDLARKQADLIAQSLKAHGAMVNIVENGSGLSLRDIGAQGAGSDCFVSLHLNAFNAKAQGHEVLIDTNGTAVDQQLAEAINAELDTVLPIANRGVKRQGLGVLRGVPLPVPAVLVESFFIDQVPDQSTMDSLVTSSSQAIAQGITRFLS